MNNYIKELVNEDRQGQLDESSKDNYQIQSSNDGGILTLYATVGDVDFVWNYRGYGLAKAKNDFKKMIKDKFDK